jgi:hypothetical protein
MGGAVAAQDILKPFPGEGRGPVAMSFEKSTA